MKRGLCDKVVNVCDRRQYTVSTIYQIALRGKAPDEKAGVWETIVFKSRGFLNRRAVGVTSLLEASAEEATKMHAYVAGVVRSENPRYWEEFLKLGTTGLAGFKGYVGVFDPAFTQHSQRLNDPLTVHDALDEEPESLRTARDIFLKWYKDSNPEGASGLPQSLR